MNEYGAYVGLDVHKDTIAVAVALPGRDEPVYRGEIKNHRKSLARLIRGLSPHGEVVSFCYEAGPCGYGVYREIIETGHHCEVVAPSLIPRRAGERVKTDRRDAVKLARLHRSGELTPVWVPGEEQEAMRDLTRAREDMKAIELKAWQRLGAFLLRHDRVYREGKSRWTQKHFRWLEEQKFEHLHYTLDVWFEREVKPRLGGEAVLVRYCDDFVIGFERREDAQRVSEVLGKRMERFGLRLHPEKTRLIAFERPEARQRGGKGPGTFEFLGFTMYWRRTRSGRWQMWCKTRSKGLRRFNRAVAEWCRRHRHLPVKVQHAALKRRLVGHFNYFGVNGNIRSLARVVYATQRVWFKWLRRRSQRTRLTWERFNGLLERFPFPRPRVAVRIWGG